MTISNYTKMLVQMLAVTWDDISESTVEQTKWVLADTLFAAWYGITTSPEIKAYINKVGSRTQDSVHCIPIIGTQLYATPENSNIIYGTAIVSNELDEGSQFAKGHPAAHIFAPIVIAAYQNNVNGKDFIRAFVIGYEVASRFAYASSMRDDMHPHGTWGIIGGTVAGGIVQRKSNKEIVEASLIAGTIPLATSWEAASTGMSVRNLYAGLASLHASLALQFQSSGFESSTHVLNHLWGEIMGSKIDYTLLLKDLWSPPLINKNYFKYYPACRFSHSAIDALLHLMEKERIDKSQIASIEVDTYNLAARMDDPDPKNTLAAKFSIPYLLSVIAHGHSLFELSDTNILSNQDIRQFARKIRIREDNELSKLLPDKRAARVTIDLKDGSTLKHTVHLASGGFDQPFSSERMIEKYKEMTSTHLESKRFKVVLSGTLSLEQNDRIAEWIDKIFNDMGVDEVEN